MKKTCAGLIITSQNAHSIAPLLGEYTSILPDNLIIIDDTGEGVGDELRSSFIDLKYIVHEQPLGYGISLYHLLEYAKETTAEQLICINECSSEIENDIKNITDQLAYGYDLVSCSRILENYGHSTLPEDRIGITSEICNRLKEITELDLTDPMSGIFGLKLNSVSNFELTDETHAILLQLWIQAAIQELTMIEVPSESNNSFGWEMDLFFDDPKTYCLAMMEAEYYLHRKGTIN